MKKLLFIAAALMMIACEGPEGPMGPQGQRGQNGKDAEDPDWYTTSITVTGDEWELVGDAGDLNSYFYAYKPLSKLNAYIYKYGLVVAYIETQTGIKNGMPFVLHLGEESGDKEFLWTQTYDFDFDQEGIGFYVTYSDFSTNIRPGAETFHVVLLW